MISDNLILFFLAKYIPFAFLLLVITNTIFIGQLFLFEKFISDFKLVPLPEIKTETLISYGVYQVENEGLKLFDYIKGDLNSIMGLPIKHVINYIRNYKND